MKKIDKVLKKLSELYEFNRKIKAYDLKKRADKSRKEAAAKNRRAP